MFSIIFCLPSSISPTLLANSNILLPNSVIIFSISFGIVFPFNTSIASITSRIFPTLFPTGSFISVIIHFVSLLANFPIFVISIASFSASSMFFIKAPLPQVTSSTILLAPEAIFLLIILDAISGMLSVQLIVSLSAYIFLSAGAKFIVCPIKLIPIFLTFSINLSSDTFVLYPGIDSSLSIVPPVIPNPLPDIFATGIPNDAIIGIRINVILSPTPPVLCLSTTSPKLDKSISRTCHS